MSRFNQAVDIISSTSETELLSPGGGGDFLSRVNLTISNFKELLKMFKEIKGLTGENPDNEKRGGNPPANPSSGIAQFVQLLIAAGYGDTQVGELLDRVRPYTIKQIVAMVKNAGLKQ